MNADAMNVNEQTNIPTAQLSSYDPVEISLADAPSGAAAEQLAGYKRAMAAIELAKRVTGDIDPAVYEQAAMGIRSQAEDQAQLEALSIAVLRYAANKHLASTAVIAA